MEHPHILILSAVRMEAAAVARAVPAGVPVLTIGIGAGRLPARVPTGCRLVILAGLAGGLDPALAVGDVVADVDGCRGEADVLRAVAGLSCVTGRITSSPVPVTTPAAKADWFARTRAAAVDMESSAVRAWAAAADVPLLHLRAVSDAADDALDPEILGLVDEVGRPRPGRVAGYLLRHPTRAPALARLGAAAKLACGRVAEA
ncbi:MAG TPA: hypothetical protein VF796_13535, partial [Humisphaera sp.]